MLKDFLNGERFKNGFSFMTDVFICSVLAYFVCNIFIPTSFLRIFVVITILRAINCDCDIKLSFKLNPKLNSIFKNETK